MDILTESRSISGRESLRSPLCGQKMVAAGPELNREVFVPGIGRISCREVAMVGAGLGFRV